MTSRERFLAALEFRTPDRIPRCDYFLGSFPDAWRRAQGFGPEADPMAHYGIDITEIVGDESFMPSRARVLSEDEHYVIRRDGWGAIQRVGKRDTTFYETLGSVLDEGSDPDRLEFDPVTDPARFVSLPEAMEPHQRAGRFMMGKSGGIYIRSHFLRGEVKLLMDMAGDETYSEALFDRVTDHLVRMSLETLKATGTLENGLLICDDMAGTQQPMFSPAMFDRYFAPRYKKWIEQVKAAGCKHVYFHSDGNILPVMDSLVAAGFEAFNPLEPRCGISLPNLRNRYGKKILLIGGVCNTRVLPRGNRTEIEASVRPLLEMGRDGGLVLGAASINGDITPETYEYYDSLCRKYGTYA